MTRRQSHRTPPPQLGPGPEEGQVPATTPATGMTLAQALTKMSGKLQAALPLGMVADRFIRIALTTIQKNPNLMDCSIASVLGTVLEAAQLGLPLDGVLGHAYPVPYKGKCQLQIGYRGFIYLAHRSSNIIMEGDLVYQKDYFEYSKGTQEKLVHRPYLKGPRGKFVCAYAVAQFPDGRSRIHISTPEEIEKARKASKDPREDAVWNTHWEEMAKKTPIRRLAKQIPLSTEDQALVKAAVLAERVEEGVPQDLDLDLDEAFDAKVATQMKTDHLADRLAQEKAAQDQQQKTQEGPKSGQGKDQAPPPANQAGDKPQDQQQGSQPGQQGGKGLFPEQEQGKPGKAPF